MGADAGACGVDALSLLKRRAEWEAAAGSTRVRFLLQPVHGVHDALKFGAVDEVERVLFAGEHFERHAASGRDHPGCFLSGKIATSNRFNREMNQNSKAADASAFVVYFFLRGNPGFSVVHDGLKAAEN